MTRQCVTPGCEESAADYSQLGIRCQLQGLPEPPRPKVGRPRQMLDHPREPPPSASKRSIYDKRHYDKLRVAGYSAQCASYKHKCLSCNCECHVQRKVA